MESKPRVWKADAWNIFEPWETLPVLKANIIGSDNLGVVIWLDGIDGTTVVPAFITYSTKPKLGRYVFQFRPSSTLKEIIYWVVPDAPAAQNTISKSSESGNWTANEPLRITIDTGTLPSGWLTLIVRARFLNEPLQPPQEFRFYHATPMPNF
jgi:hypothetical protein